MFLKDLYKKILGVLGALARDRVFWHESQKIAKLLDGSSEITFRIAGLDEDHTGMEAL